MAPWGCKARFRPPFTPYTRLSCTKSHDRCGRRNSLMSSTRGGSQRRDLGVIRGTGAGGDGGESDEISLSDLVRVLRRRRHIILTSVIVVLLLGALYCAFKTRRYEAVADLAINP